MDLKIILAEVKKLAKTAGSMMKDNMISEIKIKSDSANIVTDMDVKVQKYLIENLQNIIPNADFFAEEKENVSLSENYTWIIDPIDGTTNYAYDFKHSCVSIALSYNKEAILGVCYDPYLDEMFYAIKGQKAYLNDQLISVSKNDINSSLIMCGTAPYHKFMADKTFKTFKNLFLNCRDIRRSGSAVLDLCYLACGRVDGFYEAKLSFWDYAAASLIVQEANGDFLVNDGYWGSIEAIEAIGGNKINTDDLLKLI